MDERVSVMTIRCRNGAVAAIGFALGMALFQALSCSSAEESTIEGEGLVRQGAVAFLAGVFTVANMDDLDTSGFKENFHANYQWIKNVFLPHLKDTPKHDWRTCDEYCIKMAEKMSRGDPVREKQLREILSRYQHEHEETH